MLMESLTKPRPQVADASPTTPTVYIYPDVLDEIEFNGKWKPDLIGIGVLIGTRYLCDQDKSAFIEIEGFVAGQHIDKWDEMHVGFENEWKSALAAQRFHSSQSIVLGWYVANSSSKQGDPAQLSNIHKAFFRHPWQVGIWLRDQDAPVAFTLSNETIQPVELAVIQPPSFSSVG